LESLLDLFAEAERLERENREMYLFIAENDELKRKLIDEIVVLERHSSVRCPRAGWGFRQRFAAPATARTSCSADDKCERKV
jgi:hypothetical protein